MTFVPKGRFAQVAARLVSRFFEDDVGRSSAQLAYYLLFSLFPLLLLLNALIGVFQMDIGLLLGELEGILPAEVYGIITDYVGYTAAQPSRHPLWLGAVLGLWSVSRGVSSVMHSTARAYRIERQGWVNRALAVVMTVLLFASVLMLLVLLLVSKKLLDIVAHYIAVPGLLIALWNVLKFLVGPAFVFLILAALYHVASQRRYRFVQAMPGALLACVVWVAFSAGFSYYVSNFGSYSVVYGSLGAIMILMLWLYATGMLLIMGSEFNHVLIETKQGG